MCTQHIAHKENQGILNIILLSKTISFISQTSLKVARSVSFYPYNHKSYNVFRILNKLTLQKKLQNFVTNNVFLDIKVKTEQQQNKKSYMKTHARAGKWTQDFSHLKLMHYLCTTESTESNEFSKLFNCFDAMGRNVYKWSRICGPLIFIKFIFFCNIFTCINNYIWQFLIFTTGVGFTA